MNSAMTHGYIPGLVSREHDLTDGDQRSSQRLVVKGARDPLQYTHHILKYTIKNNISCRTSQNTVKKFGYITDWCNFTVWLPIHTRITLIWRSFHLIDHIIYSSKQTMLRRRGVWVRDRTSCTEFWIIAWYASGLSLWCHHSSFITRLVGPI